MPQYKKPGTGRDFLPGQSGNPKGRPPDSPEIKALKKLTKGELAVLLNKVLQSKPEDLKTFKGTVLELWLAAGATKAIQTGDYSRLEFLINRLIGKVPDKLEVSEIDSVSDEELLKMAENAIQSMKEKLKKE